MNRHINFEDNIFIVNMKIRIIRDLLLLDADPELFLDHTLDEISFINKTQDILIEILMNNKRYIERDEQFHNLAETEIRFQEVIFKLISEENSFSLKTTPGILEKIGLIKNQSIERRKILEKLFMSDLDKPSAEPVVSVDELSELLRR